MRKDKPSRTARKVALSVVTLGVKPGMDAILPSGIVTATEKLLIDSGAAGPRTMKWAKSRKSAAIYEAFDWMLPDQFEAFAHRKAFCERQVRDGINAGAVQILVLGAGFDTLGWRLAPEFPYVNFYEIDHPATAAFKARGVKAMGPSANLHLIAEDLGRRNLSDLLEDHPSWNRNAQTSFIAEGLLMYLSAAAVRELFRQCAMVGGSGSRMAFSFVPANGNGRLDAGKWTGLIMRIQKMVGEPWTWSIRPENLGAFLSETGWTIGPFPAGSYEKRGVEYFAAAEASCC